MRSTARLVLVCLAVMGISVPAQQAQPPRPNQDSQPPRTTQKPPLHGTALDGDHRQAARRHRRRDDVPEGRQRRRRRLRDARRDVARCGTRSAGAARRRR